MAIKKTKVLIVSENASDLFGGEAILPLRYFQLLNKENVDAYLITHARVENTLRHIPGLPQEKIFYIPDHALFKWLLLLRKVLSPRLEVLTFGSLMGLLTAVHQHVLAKRVIREKGIQLIHQPNPVSTKVPSAMFGLGVPVIIGPMNGGMNYPPAFRGMLTMPERLMYRLLRLSAHFINIVIPGKLLADLLIVANERSHAALPRLRFGKTHLLVENGVLSIVKRRPKPVQHSEKIELLFIGRMVDWKGLDILLEALHRSKNNALHLNIIGDGPEYGAMQSLAYNLGLENVTFLGHVPFDKLNDYYDVADIFVLPSLRECGGAVVLEAMARGLPVIATNWGGPADYLTNEVGFLVEPRSKEYMIEMICHHISILATQPELRAKMGLAAIRRVENCFLWKDKIRQMIALYEGVINRKE